MVSVLVLTPAVTLITPHQQYFALLSTCCLICNLICVVVSSSGLFFDAYLLLGFKVKSYSPSAFIVRNLPVPFTSGEKHTCTQEASRDTESPVELFELNWSDLERKVGLECLQIPDVWIGLPRRTVLLWWLLISSLISVFMLITSFLVSVFHINLLVIFCFSLI